MMTATNSSKTLLFVYGTLKSEYINYERYMRVAVQAGKAVLLATGTSEKKFPLVLRPLTRMPATRGPMLLSTHNSCESEWTTIDGEVYEIDEDTRQAMDILEGVSSGCYYRENIVINLHTDTVIDLDTNNDTTANATANTTTDSRAEYATVTDTHSAQRQVLCECYFYTVQESDEDLVEAGPLLSVYDDKAHAEYVAPPINNEILSLLQA